MEKKYLGVHFYFRNNSTGKPTLRHILKEDGVVYCGWKGDFGAEVFISDELDSPTEMCICKKCLKKHNLNESESATH
jgi:hypothetical protein